VDWTGVPAFAGRDRLLVDPVGSCCWLETLAAHRGLLVVDLPGPRHTSTSVLGPAARGMSELIALQRWIPDIAEREVFLCGPSTWTDGMECLLLAAGLPKDRTHTESFGW
jgi:ferredoxin-NADP reductase